MKIRDIKFYRMKIPLITPFKTAVREVYEIENLVIKIETDEGLVGYGEAPPTAPVTGDTIESVVGVINNHYKKLLVGREVGELEDNLTIVNKSVVANSSAKAALDMALYDLFCKKWNIPLYKYLGAREKKLETDLTISVNDPDEMARDARSARDRGYNTLKIKLGKDYKKDLERMEKIRENVGDDVPFRLDANQGWKPKEAIKIIDKLEERNFNIDFIEQPVAGGDLEGLKFVTDNVNVDIVADEAVFSPRDALRIMEMRAADLVNIKLMKTGGIRNALQITSLGEIYGMDCMIGCMLEGNLAITAAVHLAMARDNITKIDLDGTVLCSENPVVGGAIFDNQEITLSSGPGLGIKDIKGLEEIKNLV